MRSPSELLSALGDCELGRLIEMTDSPHLTGREHAHAKGWLLGYLLCLRDLGRITVEEYEAWASDMSQLAVAIKPEE
ncbi:hypothetical protein I5L51_09810 [Pseudomonas mendocina]|nr:hypothetical protein [Pseudomonas mendocina]MBH3339400.1 hypothetical protein [Pseudomonas mendocina]